MAAPNISESSEQNETPAMRALRMLFRLHRLVDEEPDSNSNIISDMLSRIAESHEDVEDASDDEESNVVDLDKISFNDDFQFIPLSQKTMPANPYLGVPTRILSTISQERDIILTGSRKERAEQLLKYDEIDSSWVPKLEQLDWPTVTKQFSQYSRGKLFVYGAKIGIGYHHTIFNNNDELHRQYILCYLFLGNQLEAYAQNFSELFDDPIAMRLLVVSRFTNMSRLHVNFVSYDELKYILLHGNTSCINRERFKFVMKRYLTLKRHKYSEIFRTLYNGMEFSDRDWLIVHPLEIIVYKLDKKPTATLLDFLEMELPRTLLREDSVVRQYIVDNIAHYALTLTHAPQREITFEELDGANIPDFQHLILSLSDRKIFQIMQAEVPYSGREELITEVTNLFWPNGKKVFMYLPRPNTTRSSNTTTIMDTPITEIGPVMIGYGFLKGYRTYELEELYEAFYHDKESDMTVFRKPEAPTTKFSLKEIFTLKKLLSYIRDLAPDIIDRTLQRIEIGIRDNFECLESDKAILAKYQTLTDNEKQDITSYLHSLIESGMYMRRWLGPGHPYPILGKDTDLGDAPDFIVSQSLLKTKQILTDMTGRGRAFCHSLKLCHYSTNGMIRIAIAPFQIEWQNVLNGEQCFRTSSVNFIGTGYHYLRRLCKIIIPELDPAKVEEIT